MAIPVRCCCAPSCRARSIRWRSASPAVTMRALDARSSASWAVSRSASSRLSMYAARAASTSSGCVPLGQPRRDGRQGTAGGTEPQRAEQEGQWNDRASRGNEPAGQKLQFCGHGEERPAEGGRPRGVERLDRGERHGDDRCDEHWPDHGTGQRPSPQHTLRRQHGNEDHADEDDDAARHFDDLVRNAALEERERVRRTVGEELGVRPRWIGEQEAAAAPDEERTKKHRPDHPRAPRERVGREGEGQQGERHVVVALKGETECPDRLDPGRRVASECPERGGEHQQRSGMRCRATLPGHRAGDEEEQGEGRSRARESRAAPRPRCGRSASRARTARWPARRARPRGPRTLGSATWPASWHSGRGPPTGKSLGIRRDRTDAPPSRPAQDRVVHFILGRSNDGTTAQRPGRTPASRSWEGSSLTACSPAAPPDPDGSASEPPATTAASAAAEGTSAPSTVAERSRLRPRPRTTAWSRPSTSAAVLTCRRRPSDRCGCSPSTVPSWATTCHHRCSASTRRRTRSSPSSSFPAGCARASASARRRSGPAARMGSFASIRPRTRSWPRCRLDAPLGVSRLAYGAGSLWAFSTSTVGPDTVVRIDPATNAITSTIPLGHVAGTMAFGFDALWVTSPTERRPARGSTPPRTRSSRGAPRSRARDRSRSARMPCGSPSTASTARRRPRVRRRSSGSTRHRAR